MARTKNEVKASLLERMVDEASWFITHADSLGFHGRQNEAKAEWMRAALCEKEVACLLEAEGEDLEAAIHYVSAASCYARAQQYADAIPLLRAALSFTLRDSHRKEVEALLKEWLPKAKRDLRKQARKQPAAVS